MTLLLEDCVPVELVMAQVQGQIAKGLVRNPH